MKKLILTLCLAIAVSASAQSPSPAATATPPRTAAMSLPAQTQAAFLAGQIIQQVTALLNNVQQVIDNGVPAQENGAPAIAAKDIQAALGNENVMRLRSAVAILTNGAAPAAAPTPKK